MDPTTWAPFHRGWPDNGQQLFNQPAAGSSIETLVREGSQPPVGRSIISTPFHLAESNDSSLLELCTPNMVCISSSASIAMQRLKECSIHYPEPEDSFYGKGYVTMASWTWASLVLPYAHHPEAASLREQWNGVISFPQVLISSSAKWDYKQF